MASLDPMIGLINAEAVAVVVGVVVGVVAGVVVGVGVATEMHDMAI
jgi:hypothetical protein